MPRSGLFGSANIGGGNRCTRILHQRGVLRMQERALSFAEERNRASFTAELPIVQVWPMFNC